jgi:protein involved in sex pheromone biosynthesis
VVNFKFGFKGFAIIAIAIVVLAVGLLYFFNANRVTPTTQQTTGIQVTAGNQGDYQTVIKNGRYLTSAARGITASSEQNRLDVKHFENGLLDLSKETFSPREFVFQEGQYLSSDTVISWLSRSNEDKNGLNPEENKRTDDSRNPIYIQSITEQDFMTQNGDNLKLSGMTIGLAMNTVDAYQREQYGATYTQNIDRQAMVDYGKEAAQKVIQRLRDQQQIPDKMPIMIAMYANAPADSLAGGHFYAYAISEEGTQLGEWQELNWTRMVLPKAADDDSALGEDVDNGFANFKNEVQNFFPNIAGATAEAEFRDESLTNLNIKVTTQFYSQTEINSFTAFVSQTATKYLPRNTPVRIDVQTANEMQAILVRDSGDSTFQTTILN